MIDRSNSPPRAFVIGWPIKHSRSPLIHNYWLNNLVLAGSYERLEIRPDELEGFLSHLQEKGFVGGNVTLPHKEAAFQLCAKTTATAAHLAAVNTVWIEDGQLCGDNTDVAGFLACLDCEAQGWDQTCQTAVVLGAGGAARAIVHALMLRSKPRILLVNRTRARSEDLRLHLARQFAVEIKLCTWAELPEVLETADLVVNTTSLGMVGQPQLHIDLAPLPARAIVSDIVYVPLETELVRMARSRALRAVGGLGMLLNQAVPGFEKWFGKRPQVTAELRALVEADITSTTAGKI
ncbi:MAG: shikimate dehydrogenase [Beijerinckiaceae bacterium]